MVYLQYKEPVFLGEMAGYLGMQQKIFKIGLEDIIVPERKDRPLHQKHMDGVCHQDSEAKGKHLTANAGTTDQQE